MRKFSKIAASALALALSVTMVAPISANAYVEEKNVKDGDNTYTEYTNTDTGKTYSSKDYSFWDEDGTSTDEDVFENEQSAITISAKDYTPISFKTRKDAKSLSNFKANKKALQVKVTYKSEWKTNSTIPDEAYDFSSYDSKTGTYTYYYKDSKGEIKSETDLAKLPKDTARGSYIVRLYAKKAGTYKLTYDVALEDGTTLKKTVTIIAKADGAAIKTITFAGKVIHSSDATVQNGFLQKNGSKYTTKAKGKLKVTMNKDFKLKKIEIGSANITTKDVNEQSYYYDNGKKVYYTYEKGTKVEYADDLNNDYKWTPVKNGKKINLSKINNNYGDYSYTYYDQAGKETGSSIRETKNTTATTSVRVTYYDKKDKTTKREIFHISRLINK